MTNHPTHEDLFAYRDGELDFEKRGLVEAHVLSCTACAARLEDLSDAEGAIRQVHAEPPAGYFEEMTASVMGRVAPGARAAGAARAADTAGAAGVADAASEPSRGRSGRRRNFADEGGGRAPGLPWAAIVSTVSAAAAVIVVVALLFKTPEIWKHAPEPRVVGLPESEGAKAKDRDAKENGASVGGLATPEEAAPSTSAPESNAPAKTLAGEEDKRQVAAKQDVRAGIASAPSGGVAQPEAGARLDQAATREVNEISTQNAGDVVQPPAALEKKTEAARVSRPEALASPPSSAAAPAEGPSEFEPLVARYGLPGLYDPARVSNDALLRAEPEIRALYQSGRSGADSARVRLYLAEAARLRAGDSPDEETYDTIVHHYQRAIALSRDPATWRMIKKRLEDFVSRTAPTR